MTALVGTPLSQLASHWEAIVVGAGPAGALVARQLALRGRRVLLVDKKRFPRPKVCGACLNARALSALHAAGLGEWITRVGGLPLDQFEILSEGRRVSVELPDGIAVGRAELDAGLVAEAIVAGATFCDGAAAKVGSLASGNAVRETALSSEADSAVLTASVVLAADGLQHSSLIQHDAFASQISADSLIGLGTTIPAADYLLPRSVIRMVAAPGGYVGLVRIGRDQLNIAAAVEPNALRGEGEPATMVREILNAVGACPATLSGAHWYGTGPLTRSSRNVSAERLFVLGDATGYVEPFTGEGIAWALCSALLVAPLANACLQQAAAPAELSQRWHELHGVEVLRRQRWCHRLAWILRTSWRRRLAMIAAARLPWLARRVAGVMNQQFVPTAETRS